MGWKEIDNIVVASARMGVSVDERELVDGRTRSA